MSETTTVWAVTDPQGQRIGVGIDRAGALLQATRHPHSFAVTELADAVANDDGVARAYEHAGYRVAPMALLAPEALAVVEAAVAWQMPKTVPPAMSIAEAMEAVDADLRRLRVALESAAPRRSFICTTIKGISKASPARRATGTVSRLREHWRRHPQPPRATTRPGSQEATMRSLPPIRVPADPLLSTRILEALEREPLPMHALAVAVRSTPTATRDAVRRLLRADAVKRIAAPAKFQPRASVAFALCSHPAPAVGATVRASLRAPLLAALADGPKSVPELAAILGRSDHDVRNACRQAEAQGAIESVAEHHGIKRSGVRYQLSDSPAERPGPAYVNPIRRAYLENRTMPLTHEPRYQTSNPVEWGR